MRQSQVFAKPSSTDTGYQQKESNFENDTTMYKGGRKQKQLSPNLVHCRRYSPPPGSSGLAALPRFALPSLRISAYIDTSKDKVVIVVQL